MLRVLNLLHMTPVSPGVQSFAYAVNPGGACHRRAWPPAHEVLGDYVTIEDKAELIQEMYNENCYKCVFVILPGLFL